MPKKSTKIGLMGPFGFGNLGDAAIQQSMITNIQHWLPEAEVVGISLNAEDTTLRHHIPAISIGRMANHGWELEGRLGSILRKWQLRFYHHPTTWIRRPARLLLAPLVEALGVVQTYRKIRDWTAVFASGGGQIDDYWGGAWSHPYTMWLWGVLCSLRRVKYRLVSVGAGPLDEKQSERFIRGALDRADYRSFRDEPSRQFMAKRGFFRDDPVYPDLAHSLPVNNYLVRPQRAFPNPPNTPIIGVGPMAYYDPRVWPKKDSLVYQGYLRKLAEFTGWLVGRGCRIVLFPGEAAHDREVIHDFLDLGHEFGLLPGENICSPSIETVDELMYTLSGVDLVVAARFHGVLLPMLLDKPVLATSYHPKVDELMKDTGQSEYCLSIDTFTVAELQEKFTCLEANQEHSRSQIHARIAQYRQALDEQYERIFNDI